MMRSQTDISIIIPVHNGGSNFKRCLTAVNQLTPQPQEVIVVANGDTDGSWLTAKQLGATIIRIPTAVGPGIARNIGARSAKGNYLLFIDADVEIQPTTLTQVVNVFEQYPHLTAIIGSYDDSPDAKNFLSQYRNLLHHHIHQSSHEHASTFWAGCGAIDRDIFLAMGGFDQRYRRPCIEDIELGYRLTQAGYAIRLCKEIQVKHLKYWDALSILKTDIFDRALPWSALILNNRQFNNDLNLKVEHRISVCLTYSLIFSMIVGIWYPVTLSILTVILGFSLVVLNAPLYKFFYRRHGLIFAIKAIVWHWLYYLYSGFAFAAAVLSHQLGNPGFLKTILQKKTS